MIYNYPFYGFHKKYYKYPTYYSDQSLIKNNFENKTNYQEKKEIPSKSNNDIIFEIFGIKLHFDDLLLISLIFFLYNEGVNDQYLFIALILLLLS